MTDRARKPRVFLVGYYGFDNLGDEAILAAIRLGAERHGVEIVRYATRGDPTEDRAVPVRGPGVWRYVRACREADRVVLGGGGILKDEGMWLPVELFLTALLARVLRRPVALLAVGVGPFHHRIGRALAAATARLASVRTVRDGDSAAALARLGVRGAEVGADPVFTMPVPAGHQRAEAQRRAVVSVRPWFLGGDPSLEPRRVALRASVGQAIEVLLSGGWRVDLVPLYWPRDRDESTAVVAETGLGGGVTVIDRAMAWQSLVDLVAGADLVIAMRYHAVAAAAVAGTPTIALAYEPKVSALAGELGILALDVTDPDLGARLRAAVEATVAGADGAPVAPSPGSLAALRERAERSLARALTGRRLREG